VKIVRNEKMRRCRQSKRLCDRVEALKGFCYLGENENASGKCEATVTARASVGWMKFRECSELLRGIRFQLQIQGNILKVV